MSRGAAAKQAPAVVFETSVLLRALLGSTARARGLRRAWQGGACQAVVDAGSARSLMLALGAPALGLSADQQQELLADFLPYARVIATPEAAAAVRALGSLPPLSRQGLTLARRARARWLVSDCMTLRLHFDRSRIARTLELADSEKFLTRF